MEAYYLEGVLNSEFLLNKFSYSSLKSERDITKKIFEMGIPKFNKNNPAHIKIAEYAQLLERDNTNQDNLKMIEKFVSKILN